MTKTQWRLFKRHKSGKQPYFYINQFDSNAVWYTMTLLIGIMLICSILFVAYKFTVIIFIPDMKAVILEVIEKFK